MTTLPTLIPCPLLFGCSLVTNTKKKKWKQCRAERESKGHKKKTEGQRDNAGKRNGQRDVEESGPNVRDGASLQVWSTPFSNRQEMLSFFGLVGLQKSKIGTPPSRHGRPPPDATMPRNAIGTKKKIKNGR
jgi:hypothetical protein